MNNSHRPRSRGGRDNSRSSYKRRPSGRGRPSGGQGRGRFKQNKISLDKFVNKTPTTYTKEDYTPKHTFYDFGFHPDIVRNLKRRGYQSPTRIQDQSMPHVLAGKDVVGLANTGSGKTAAFILPIIQKIKKEGRREAVLVVAPTRELAQQIHDEFRRFSDKMHLYSSVCVGGLNIRMQIRDLRRKPHIVIGTPGRLKDLINQGELRLASTNVLVLDEMDRMLDMGFLPDIKFILGKIKGKKQSLCFGATITPQISRLLDDLLINPVTVSVRTSETGEHIAQDVIRAGTKEEKMKELASMLDQDHFEKVLIFGQMKHGVQKLADSLTRLGYPAMAIHGNKSQSQRQRVLDAFKRGRINILVATDVAARGLDIPDVSHVINFDKPDTHEEYIHRIGRTGRAGKRGQAYTFV